MSVDSLTDRESMQINISLSYNNLKEFSMYSKNRAGHRCFFKHIDWNWDVYSKTESLGTNLENFSVFQYFQFTESTIFHI